MKNKNLKSDSNSSPEIPIEQELESFRVTIPSYVIELRKENKFSQHLGEYLTVKYNIPLKRKQKRLLLQTLLDSIMRKEVLHLNLGEYIILEDLVFKIESEDSIERKEQEKYKEATNEMLGFALLILQVLPLRTMSKLIFQEEPETIREKLNKILEECSFFRISDNRTYGSRRSSYDFLKVIEFTVQIPLENEEKSNSIPYSSYTKGYGESSSKKLQTPIDWEIDGEDIWNFDNSQTYSPKDFLFKYRKLET